MELRRLYIKDADRLKDLPLPRQIRGQKNARQAFLRQPGLTVYLLESEGKEALICGTDLPYAPIFRCFRFLSDHASCFSPEACAARLFEEEKDVFSLDLLFSGEGEEKEAEGSLVLENSLGFPQRCRRLHFERPAVLPYLSLIPGLRFSLILEVNRSRDRITGLRFLRDKDAVKEKDDARFLAWLGCLDEQGCYVKAAAITDPRREARSPLQQKAEEELSDYLRGRRREFDLPLDFEAGTEFQQKVWAAMEKIPYGSAISYEELAARAFPGEEKPRRYARAVGMACGANPICILLPCHRVIGSGGELVGFSGGVDVKASLLDLELFNYRGKGEKREF